MPVLIKSKKESIKMKRLISIAVAALFFLSSFAMAEEKKKEEVTRLEEVVVTAPHMIEPLIVETNPKAPRQPVPAHDGADYLKTIPGFSVIRKGGTDGDPVFRGMAGSRLNVLIDGQYILGGCGGRMDPPTAYVFPEIYDKIRILKGPQTVKYGGGNIGGTVLFEHDIKYFEKPGVRTHTGLTLGSFGRNDQIVDVSAGVPLGFINITGSRSDSDNYKDGDGRNVHSSYTRWSLGGSAGWTPDKNTRLIFSFDRSDGEAAYADRMMDGTKFDRTGYSLKFEKTSISPLLNNLTAQVYYNYIDHIMDNYSMRTVMPNRYSLNNPDRETKGGRISADINLSDNITLTIGTDYQWDKRTFRGRMNQTGPIDVDLLPRTPDMTFENAGVFGEITYSISQNDRIISGIRGDFLNVKDERTVGRRITDEMFGGFVRYEHEMTPTTFYIGIGHAQRPADWWERNRDFFLNPEKDSQIDAGVIYSSNKIRAGLSVFYANIDDFILVGGGGRPTRNIDAETYGGEAEVSYLFIKNWKAGATLAYVHGNNKTDNVPLAQMPPLEGRLTLNYDDNVFSAGAILRLVAKQDRLHIGYGNIVGQDIGGSPGFGVISVNAGYRPLKGLLITAGIDNLFDKTKTYAEHISRAGAAVAGYEQTTRVNEPGRNF